MFPAKPAWILAGLLFAVASCDSQPQGTTRPEIPSGSTPTTTNQTMVMTWNDVLQFARKGSPAPARRVEKTDEEWKRTLTPEQFQITRKKGTERPFTGEYCESHAPGVYTCVGCGTVLFDSRTKFESGTGWPSFTEPATPAAIKYEEDRSHGMHRIEVMCNVCDGHLGHVFPDGPGDGGLRFCINSASLRRVDDSVKVESR